MSFIKWQEAFLTGIPKVDAQHQKLIETLNNLHFLLKKGENHEEIFEILQFLDQYTVEHFSTEEALMKKADGKLPEDLREKHFREHRYFIDKVQEFHGIFDAYRQGEHEREAMLKLFAFLSHWLCEHILKTDRETASYLV